MIVLLSRRGINRITTDGRGPGRGKKNSPPLESLKNSDLKTYLVKALDLLVKYQKWPPRDSKMAAKLPNTFRKLEITKI